MCLSESRVLTNTLGNISIERNYLKVLILIQKII